MLSPMLYALQRGILLRRENPTYRYWAPVDAATRGFKMVLFTASRGNNFVGGTCAPPSALLVVRSFVRVSVACNAGGGGLSCRTDMFDALSISLQWTMSAGPLSYC